MSERVRLFHLCLMLSVMIIMAPGVHSAQAPAPQPTPVAAPAGNAAAAPATAAVKINLTNEDCAKCHDKAPADISAGGGAHKTSVSCQDCHAGHPPKVAQIVPKCSQCHSGKAHYQLQGCNSCHTNPHRPKNISFDRKVTDACLTCHTEQIKVLKGHQSKHSELPCAFCHSVHRKKPECTQCHKPHAKGMAATDCNRCHQAHMPNVVTYKENTPSKDCASCHGTAFEELSASKSKHRSITCATCHQDKHKTVPNCQDCHGTPHPPSMMSRFGKCGECHNTAHDLNHWPATPPAKESKQQTKSDAAKKGK